MEKLEGEEDTEYESDPEEAKMSLKMRRREASDDEDAEEERERGRSGIVDSEGESDGQGAAADYDDDEDEEEEEEDEDGEEYYGQNEQYEQEEREIGVGGVGEKGVSEAKAVGEGENSQGTAEQGEEVEGGEGGEGEEVEKKENEPFAVPTSGAFYMHDDRFRDNAGGRHRRTFAGRRLWESKDERKWGHDKFEELNTDNRNYEEERRPSKGFYRGRGRARGTDRGYAQGSRMRGYSGNSNQSAPPKDVRGRGPRRYQPSMKNRSETFSPHNKQFAKALDKNSHGSSGRVFASTASSNVDHEPVPAKKVASNLSSASPPFYPSASSNKDIALTHKKEIQAGNHNRNIRPSAVDNNFSMPQSTSLRGKNVIDSMGMDKLHIDDSISPANIKNLNNVHMSSSASPLVGATQMTQSKAQGRGVAPSGSAMFQPPQVNNQVNKVSSPQAQASQRSLVQSRGQNSLQASGQQLVQRPLGGSQSSSPPKAGLPSSTFEGGNLEAPLETGNSKIALAGKGKLSSQGAGRGTLMYGGSQVMGPGGNLASGHGDPNIPAFFPVMQFGGQHPGGMGVPAVGMAFPGYVAQPNGLGNSEMTWLPVLASAAGALGASYCPPFLSVDGSYNPRPTGQTSALPAPSKDNNLSKPNNELKPQQRSDAANDEFSQRQNKPRRYSEMKFSQ